MDKTKSPKGIINIKKHENQVLPHYHSADKDKHFFQVKENDFPSLSEVQNKNTKSEKESSAYSASSLTYSSKLKTLLAECSLQNMKFDNVRHNEPKVESVSSKGLSKNKSPLSQVASGRHIVKPSQSVHPNRQSLTKQSSNVYNSVPSVSKKSTDSKLNSSFSEDRNKKFEYFSRHTDMKISHGQKSTNDSRSSKTAQEESNIFERVQKSSFSKSLSSPRKSNVAYSSELRSDISYKKENDRSSISTQHKKHIEANRIIREENGQGVKISQVNTIQSNVSGNTSNKTRVLGNLGSQMANSSVKTENNATGNQSVNARSSLPGPSETKKKKKRKSKLKRQAALQTGKILVLTPEVHSKIISQSNNVCVQRHQNVLTNINDNEEYPELGLAEPKTVKKIHSTKTNAHTEEENPNNFIATGSETDKKGNYKDSSANNNFEAAKQSDEKNKAANESEGGKSTIHSNNPITLSLFDMLVAAKTRKKVPEKKEESAVANNSSAKVFKKEMTKKNIPQAVNPLVSSKPTIKRGKEREKPKVKRPSRMRKLILLERQLRKENMAIKKYQAEDENQEKSEKILSDIHLSNNINDILAYDNLEISDENLLNYVTDTENSSSETSEIYDDVNSKTLEQFVLECEDANFQPVSKNQDLINQSKLINELSRNANQILKNHRINCSNVKGDFNIISSSIIDIQNDLVSNPISNLADNEKHFVKDLADINASKDINEICSSIKNMSKKYSDINDSICNAGCIDGNFMENGKKTENSCDTYKFINKMLESNCKTSDFTENIPIIADCNINTKFNEVNSGEKKDLTEGKPSHINPDSSEIVISNISAKSFSDQERLKATKLMLHSRKFRLYCNHFISKEIDDAVFSLIDDLARFQDRMYQKDPVKAKIRRRLVYGIKEIKKHMKLKKVKCIIIATDIEDIKIEGGLNDSLGELISLAEAYLIPCVFSHRRFNLGKVCRKSVPVSCVGIFNYEGSEKNFKKMIELQDDSKHDYLEVTKKLASELTNDQVKELFEAEKESVLFVREVSQKILREKMYFTPEEYRKNETSKLLEKSAHTETEDSVVVSLQHSEDYNLHMNNKKSPSFLEEFKKLDQNSIQLNETDINTILVKYKVVKEC